MPYLSNASNCYLSRIQQWSTIPPISTKPATTSNLKSHFTQNTITTYDVGDPCPGFIQACKYISNILWKQCLNSNGKESQQLISTKPTTTSNLTSHFTQNTITEYQGRIQGGTPGEHNFFKCAPSNLKSWIHPAYDVGDPCPSFIQARKCGVVKPVNRILITITLITITLLIHVDTCQQQCRFKPD